MIAFLDSSVILRVIFGEKNILAEWDNIQIAIASELAKVECLRTLDRYRIRQSPPEKEYLHRVKICLDIFEGIELVKITPAILERASQSFPSLLTTLDALHLATFLQYRNTMGAEAVLCTHDVALGNCALALAVPVVGL